MTVVVVNKNVHAGYYISVTGETPMGNEYLTKSQGGELTGEESSDMYAVWLRGALSNTESPQSKYMKDITKDAMVTDEVALGCDCGKHTCHAFILARYINRIIEPNIIIAGGRDFNSRAILDEAMSKFLSTTRIITVISGKAKGADQLGAQWARDNDQLVVEYPARWKEVMGKPKKEIKVDRRGNKYWVRAGMVRNQAMLANATALVAFWDGKSRGTENMISIATKKNIYVGVYNY